ncbi:MAG: hypothetical protein ACLUKH_21375 [Flavonifractor plautii]
MTTTATKEYTIRDIETLTEAQAAEMAIEGPPPSRGIKSILWTLRLFRLFRACVR